MTGLTRRSLLGAAATALATNARANVSANQHLAPRGPIRSVVGVPPAGSADPLTRAIADQLSKRLDQSIVIENKTGASQAHRRARSRQCAAGRIHAVHGVRPGALTRIRRPSSAKGFDPVIEIASQPMIIAGTVKRSTHKLARRARSGKSVSEEWSFATAGVASSQHIAGEWLNSLAGTKIQHVPYRGGGAAVTDAISGQVPLIIIGAGPIIPQLEAGTLRAYALTTRTRLASLPNVPTLAELGFAEVDLSQWFGVAVRSGTPQAIVGRLNAEINAILQTPALQDMVTKLGAVTVGGSAEQWGHVFTTDEETYTNLARRLDIPLQ